MARTDYFDDIQKFYIAYYQRPADPEGLVYWAGRLDDAGGDINQIINAFATSEEATNLYGPIDENTIGDVIDQVYQALFNRAPDEGGKKYYVDNFKAGTFSAGDIVLRIVDGARNDDARDADAIQNKLQAAQIFTTVLDPDLDGAPPFQAIYNADDLDAARAWLTTVTSDPSTRVTDTEVVESIQALIANPHDPIRVGKTFVLTTNADTFPGTDLDDTVTGVSSAFSSAGTLHPTDRIDGAAGNDTLKVDLQSSFAGFTDGHLKNVETVELTNSGTIGLDFNASGVTGVQEYVLDGDVNLSNLGNIDLTFALKGSEGEITADNAGVATVNVSGESDSDLTLSEATGVTLNVAKDSSLTGSIDALKAGSLKATIDGQLGTDIEDAASFELPEATGAVVFTATDSNAAHIVDLEADKLTDLDITTAGDFTFRDGSLAGLESLTVDTDGDFSIGESFRDDDTIGPLSAIHSVELSGTGTATLGVLGDYNLDYGITVNAGGLSNNGETDALTIDTIEVGKGWSIELNVADVAGDVRLIHHAGVARDGGAQTGSITVNADGTQGNVYLGTLDAKTVTVDAGGAVGEVHIGGVEQTTGEGGITAETAIFTGSELMPNTVYVTASKSATLTGGIDDDTFMMVAGSQPGDTATFTITGGRGDNTFLIDWEETLDGKAIATITDFEDDDTTNIAVESLAKFEQAAEALGVLQDAGLAPFTASPEDISFLDLDLDLDLGNETTYDRSVFTYGGNTYAVVGDWVVDGNGTMTLSEDTHNGSFDNGEILIQLLGVQDPEAIGAALTTQPA